MSRRRPAFTLIELLVVLSIVAVLVGLAFPVFRQVRMHAMAAQSGNNLRQLVSANLAYVADHGCYVPAFDITNNIRWCGARTSSPSAFDPTKGYLSPYLGYSRMITPDPLFTNYITGSASFEDGSGGYGYNEVYIGGTPAYNYNADGSCVSATPAVVQLPTETVMFATTAYAVSGGAQEYPFAEPPFWDFGDGPTSYRPSPSVHFRFNGKAIVGWCDGHTSMEVMVNRPDGTDPNGGDAAAQNLGWFGPDTDNGYWKPSH
jgi:prepilin-type N-terminal cleavage/methylation domain-containing protein/prepilin-type processing-associated H-X9-DG protein